MKPKVYLETSFVSYLAARLSQDLTTLQRQLSSQRWWEEKRHEFELLAAESVFLECTIGDLQAIESRMSVLAEVRLLPLNDEILTISRRLIHPGPFPRNSAMDAIHIAACMAATTF